MINKREVMRSIELYDLGKKLQEEARTSDYKIQLTRDAPGRERNEVSKVVVAFGSYDPLTKGHGALFLTGLDAVKGRPSRRDTTIDDLLIVTSTAHFNKQVDLRKNAAIYDRIHAQEGFASSRWPTENVSLGFFNNPYFVNLIPAIEQTYSERADIYFVVGADVMEKIVDVEEYEKRGFNSNAVLATIFRQNWLVCDRFVTYKNGKESRNLDATQLAEENPVLQQYADRVIGISLDGGYEDLEVPIETVSSTMIRTKRNNREPFAHLTAAGISEFVDKRDLYLQDSNLYEATVCTMQMFADAHRGKGVPISSYICAVMTHLERINNDPILCDQTIRNYRAGNFRVVSE